MSIRIKHGAAAVPVRFDRVLIVYAMVLLMTWNMPRHAKADDDSAEAVQELQRMWKERQEEMAGWKDEKQGPTWKQFLTNQPDGADKLLMPKTIEALAAVKYWLDLDHVKETAEQGKNEAAAKSIMADAHKTVDESGAKLNAAFNHVLDEAEKDNAQAQNELARIKAEDLRLAADHWFEGTPYHDRNVARARNLKEKWETMVASGEKEREDALAKMTADAATAWPAMASPIQAQDGFTPDKLDAFKGKTIRIKGNNALGSTYNPGDYDYVHEINGMPVAGRFTPAVAEAVDKATKQTGHDLPGSDWDIFAVVEGPGRISHRTHSDGKLKVDGQEVGTVTAEGQQSVSCVVVRIFAVHAGPVALKSSATP
jgi:hypothetical protein